ncbi:MAG: flippase [Ignavibacteria bacterium]|nr:flippase [Ignavibacteria bacterium]
MDKKVNKSLGRNFLSVSGGQFLSLLLNLISVGLAGKYLGVNGFGEFNYLLAIIAIIAAGLDFGINPIVFREISKNPKNSGMIISTLYFRMFLFILVAIGYNFYAFYTNLKDESIIIFNILFINIIFSNKYQNFRELLAIPMKVELKMHKYMIIVIGENILFLILVFLIPLFDLGLLYFSIIYTVSNIPGFFIILNIITRAKIPTKLKIEEIKWLVKESLPIGVYLILSSIFYQIDTIFLQHLSSSESVGLYSAGVRLSRPLMIIPNALVMSVFPMIVNKIQFKQLDVKQLNFLIKLLVLIAGLFFTLSVFKAEEICSFVFGEAFRNAGKAFSLLIAALVFMYLNYFLLDILTALEKQRYNFYIAVIVLVVSIISNLILIPQYNYIGAGVSLILSTFIGTIVLVSLYRKLFFSLTIIEIRTIIFFLLLLSFAFIISSIPLLLFALIMVILSLILLVKCRVLSKYEWTILLKLINKEKWIDWVL